MYLYIDGITKIFTQKANANKAKWAKEYLLNQFEFFGLVTAERRKLCKDYMKQNQLTDWKEIEKIVKECWQLPEREYQYFAVELIAFNKKIWQPSVIKSIEYCLVHKSWWDSVDHICSECLDDYFKQFPEQILPVTSKWNISNNIWLQRSSIMFQKKFKQKTNTALLTKYILHCCNSKEFFVQKAIGWALREYGKTNEEWVKKFVTENKNKLSNFIKKEALKRMQ